MQADLAHIILDNLMDEIVVALNKVSPYGSIEIFVQNNIVTQITTRNIKKTNTSITRKHKTKLRK